MPSENQIQVQAKRALKEPISKAADKMGYVRTPEENLLTGVKMNQFEDDLLAGDGNELRMKFCAAHSSAALAINCFAWFKDSDRMPMLSLCGLNSPTQMIFERQFRIFKGGRAPNLDVWIGNNTLEIAIESKLTEYLKRKQPKFSEAYDTLQELAEPCWWAVYSDAKHAGPGFLDIAQLVKHYFGLRTYQLNSEKNFKLIFLYLYWEPGNWRDIPPCIKHREEIEQLKSKVSTSSIKFQAMTYSELLEEWASIPGLAKHVANLRARYEIRI